MAWKKLSNVMTCWTCAGLVCVLLGWPLNAWTAVYHVDASRGTDDAPGTEAEPFRTVRRASESLNPGDRVVIHEGIYHEQIVGGRSGTAGAPIVYEGVSRDKVVLQGSVLVKDWQRIGPTWTKQGLHPITPENAFVMVDDQRLLSKVDSAGALTPGSFFLAPDGTYVIRLWGDSNPNTDHRVEAYEYDFAFNSGDRWGGTAKKWIVLRSMTLEKYGTYAVSTDARHPEANSHWELDRVRVRYNNAEGIFHCLDDWYVHDCEFVRNRGHGCQIDGARVRFVRNICSENEWFGQYEDAGCGLLIGPDSTANSCEISHNVFENNGSHDGYGCGVYLEGRSHDNRIRNNLVIGGTAAGIAFYGSRGNRVAENALVNIAPRSNWNMAAAFVFHHSFQGSPTPPEANVIERNIVWGCPRAIAAEKTKPESAPRVHNRFVDNLFARCRFGSGGTNTKGIVMESSLWYECGHGGELDDAGNRLKLFLKGLLGWNAAAWHALATRNRTGHLPSAAVSGGKKAPFSSP